MTRKQSNNVALYGLDAECCNCKTMKDVIDDAAQLIADRFANTPDCLTKFVLELHIAINLLHNVKYAMAVNTSEFTEDKDASIRDKLEKYALAFNNSALDVISCNQDYVAHLINGKIRNAYIGVIEHPQPETPQ